MLRQDYSPREVARSLGVSESSVKRWCDAGHLRALKTMGGHRRVAAADLAEFVRRMGLKRPELAVPGHSLDHQIEHHGKQALRKFLQQAVSYFVEGREKELSHLLTGLYLSGSDLALIADELITPALLSITEQRAAGRAQVYQERRAYHMVALLCHELMRLLPDPKPGAPLAVGGSLSEDKVAIPNLLIQMSLRELGWRVSYLGTDLPPSSLAHAFAYLGASLCWVSIPSEAEQHQQELHMLSAVAEAQKTHLIIVGSLASMRRKALSELGRLADGGAMQELRHISPVLPHDGAPLEHKGLC